MLIEDVTSNIVPPVDPLDPELNGKQVNFVPEHAVIKSIGHAFHYPHVHR